MGVVTMCIVLVLLGLFLLVRWGALTVEARREDRDPAGEPPSAGLVARRFLRGAAVVVGAGVLSGVLMAGAGGRLVMRLLAVTADSAAQGRKTEADEIVGRITFNGTMGVLIFVGLFAGLATAAVYILIRRWLPDGRLGGFVYGLLLLVAVAPSIDPLRENNPDFRLVGPGWVAVLAFGALVVLHGMLVAAAVNRYSRAVPLLDRSRRAVLMHAPVLLLGLTGPVVIVLAVVCGLAVIATRSAAVVRAWRAPAATRAGRVVLGLGGVAALPGFVFTVNDIVGRA